MFVLTRGSFAALRMTGWVIGMCLRGMLAGDGAIYRLQAGSSKGAGNGVHGSQPSQASRII